MIVKSNGLYLWPSKSTQDPVFVMKFELCAYLARLLRKLGHVLLWIITEHQYWTVTVQYLCRVKKISMTSNDLPLHFAPSQASGDVVKLFFWVSFYYIFKKTKAFHFKSKAFLFYSDKFPKNQKLFVLNQKLFFFLMTRFLQIKSFSF